MHMISMQFFTVTSNVTLLLLLSFTPRDVTQTPLFPYLEDWDSDDDGGISKPDS